MRLCRPIRPRIFPLASLLVLSFGPGFGAAERLLTGEELAALDRENRMWRLMAVADEAPANLQRLRQAGFGAEEIDRFQPKLEEIWTVKAERNFGWLNAEAVEKVQAVDREFIPRMRAARLRETVGIQAGTAGATITEVNRQWRRAILEVLEHDELAEFRLVNSLAAREISRLLEGIPLSTGEERRLFQLERDFRAAYQPDDLPPRRTSDAHQREARLDHLTAIRDTLGDDRFATYLGRADPEFAEMRPALARAGAEEPGLALELWRIRQKHLINRAGAPSGPKLRELEFAAQAAAMALLGEERFRRYAQDENSRWMFASRSTPRKVVGKSP
ncbi:MAG TPA: hypothetical protein VG734_01280 [Lacunisphaera sp.]|nr:hypothetical protein [Lacunisphaera sp.]